MRAQLLLFGATSLVMVPILASNQQGMVGAIAPVGTSLIVGTMREQKSGHVINLSSIAGHVVFPGAAVYCATKFAVRALSEGLRMESNGEIRATNISPGAVATELTGSISDSQTAEGVGELYSVAIDADAIARTIAFAIEQPADVDVNEMIIRPTKQEL